MQLVKEQGIAKNVVFKNSAYGASHWFQAVNFHGDGLVSTRTYKQASITFHILNYYLIVIFIFHFHE